MKTIGIIGAGHIAQAFAGHLVKNNIPVLISNSRGPETLGAVVSKLGDGVKAVAIEEAADADIVVLALPWWEVKTLSNVRDWTGKIVIDITNEFLSDGSIDELGDTSSTRIVQDHIPGAHVVKAFNALFAEQIASDPAVGKGHRIVFVAGDDEKAKKEVVALIKSLGFAPVDMGSIDVGGKSLGAKGALSGLNAVKL